jgi:DNA-directed RNA polymerase subunit RPC12/RpoP
MEAPASDEEEVTSDEEEDEVNGDEETDQSTSDESDEEDGTVSNDTREEKRQEVTIQKEKECTICLEDVATDHYPDLPHAGDSKHGSDVCLRCWDQHLESEITSKGFEGVSCPQCSQRLLETEVRKLATKGTYDQYEIRSS